MKRWTSLTRHISNVQKEAELLGRLLIETGKEGMDELARDLVSTAMSHDASKFHGIEWEHLWEDEPKNKFNQAIRLHWKKNRHHPEHWHNINKMPLVYIAEMVCDWSARCSESGKDFSEFILGINKRWKVSARTSNEIRFFANKLDGRIRFGSVMEGEI